MNFVVNSPVPGSPTQMTSNPAKLGLSSYPLFHSESIPQDKSNSFLRRLFLEYFSTFLQNVHLDYIFVNDSKKKCVSEKIWI